MELYRTYAGIARREDDELAVLDLPHPDIGALLADGIDIARTAPIRERLPLTGTALRSPVGAPGTLVLAGLSYAGHIAEAGLARPEAPQFLPMAGGRLDDPGVAIAIPEQSGVEVDYEGEIALVIGKPAADLSERDAWGVIAGLTILNDVSERREQREAMSGNDWDLARMIRSKRHPTFKPCGPAVVTADEFGENPDLEIRTLLNGEVVQHDRTKNMIFSFTEQLVAVSHRVPLHVGDVVTTGTPAGVGLATGRYLRPGDVVEIRVEGIGALLNPVSG
jgi:2-keto-4-pentenoate hydratase/2-oxohepta-3-ene-1,7-dioic acid hydratase in catechol pathway